MPYPQAIRETYVPVVHSNRMFVAFKNVCRLSALLAFLFSVYLLFPVLQPAFSADFTTGEMLLAQTAQEKPPAQGGPSYTPNYDINKAMGSKGHVTTVTPQDYLIAPDEPLYITLYMPAVGVYQKAEKRIYGPAAAGFVNLRVSGAARWETLYYDGHAPNQTIKLVLWQAGKPVKYRVSKTDGSGEFSFNMPVNPKGSQSLKTIYFDITRHLTHGYWPPEFGAVPPDPATGQTVAQKPAEAVPPQSDWKKVGFAKVSKLHAAWKDYQHAKAGGIGTPNSDQWQKNHAAGRDDVNTLILIIDLATAPATSVAGVMQNANTTYKRLTGKPLPFVNEKTKEEKAIGKAIRNTVWEKINSVRNYDQVGN